MEPQPNLAIVATVQQAITSLLTTYEPEFLRMGHSLFVAFATILIVWQGIQIMLSGDSLGDHLFGFAKLLLFIAFGYAMVAFYESPIPGIGVSFSNLITDQAHEFANILDARSLELVYDHLDELWQRFVQPDAWSILANLIYWLLLIVVTLAKVVSLAVVAFGLIASAGVRSWPDLRAVLHRAEAGFAVLVLVQGVHSVLVHSGDCVRVPDGVRAVRLPVLDHDSAGDHRGPVHGVRPASVRRDRRVRGRHLAGAVADEFDLLGRRGSQRASRPPSRPIFREP